MNVTETYEEVLRLAKQSPDAQVQPSRWALISFAGRVRKMRGRLNAQRRARNMPRLQRESFDRLRSELEGLRKCDACIWNNDVSDGTINPLDYCTGAFGCAMECLRYKSSEWHPDIFKL